MSSPLESSDAVRYFERTAGVYAAQAAADPCFVERLRVFARLISRHRPDQEALAIDLGCGSGVIARHLVEIGFRTVGIDGSAAMLEAARSSAAAGTHADFLQSLLPLSEATVERLAGTASLVIASSVIEYLDQDQLFIEQCARLLKPGGVALVSFANGSSIYRRVEARLRDTIPLGGEVSRSQRRQHTESQARQLTHCAGLQPGPATYYTLPAHRYARRLVGGRRPVWLATLFALEMKRPPSNDARAGGYD
jgi:2-polyprenyl-3-methyl-5-hydroxy-6-metoxy-1,4-benzoquinol methylase